MGKEYIKSSGVCEYAYVESVNVTVLPDENKLRATVWLELVDADRRKIDTVHRITEKTYDRKPTVADIADFMDTEVKAFIGDAKADYSGYTPV